MYAWDHVIGYNSDVIASALKVNKLYWDDTNKICLSTNTKANKDKILSGDKHSKSGKSGMPDHTLGSFEGGQRNDIGWSPK